MLRKMLLAASIVLVGSTLVHAQQSRPQVAPEGKKIVSADSVPVADVVLEPIGNAGQQGKRIYTLNPIGNQLLMPTFRYAIGVDGVDTNRGFMVLGTRSLHDVTLRRLVSPATNASVDFTGTGRYVHGALENGDVIYSIDGFRVRTANQVVVALQISPYKQSIPMKVIDFNTGDLVDVFITPARIRN